MGEGEASWVWPSRLVEAIELARTTDRVREFLKLICLSSFTVASDSNAGFLNYKKKPAR